MNCLAQKKLGGMTLTCTLANGHVGKHRDFDQLQWEENLQQPDHREVVDSVTTDNTLPINDAERLEGLERLRLSRSRRQLHLLPAIIQRLVKTNSGLSAQLADERKHSDRQDEAIVYALAAIVELSRLDPDLVRLGEVKIHQRVIDKLKEMSTAHTERRKP